MSAIQRVNDKVVLEDPTAFSRGLNYGVQHFFTPLSGTLLEILKINLNLEETRALELLSLGSVYMNKSRLPDQPELYINSGEYFRVHTDPRRYDITKLNVSSLIVYQNADFIVVNKPSGLPVHGTVDNLKENVLQYLKTQMNTDFFITHRLDIATSGLMIYAKTVEYQKLFNSFLRESLVTKIYEAKVRGLFTHLGLLTHYMEPSPRAPKKVSTEAKVGWAKCLLEVLEVQPKENETTLVRVKLLTGRTHQIRAQLSSLGHPIVGDHWYGDSLDGDTHDAAPNAAVDSESIALQSCELSFPDHFNFVL